ncbi:MAG TPA: cyclic nucleotide-binding domain-containing protein [Roseiflexaceae bacterium]|nr:cyclic nucleotide-binding domain-containing protein [Roseiflexaceae bacterium]
MDGERLLLAQLLEQNPLFAALSEDEAAFLLLAGQRRAVAAGEQLFASGSPGDELFIVLDGTIQILMPSQDGDVFVEQFRRGDMLGEIAVLDDQPRTATGRAAEPAAVLAIKRHDFHAFLERFPHYRQRLIAILVQRLRRTSDLVSEMLTVESGVVLPPDQHVAPRFQTTIVGYGRYGNNYIGPKYAKPGYPWEPVAVVDPQLTRGKFAVSMLGRTCPEVVLLRSFHEWRDGYFARLAPEDRARQVLEIPLKPELLYDQVVQYIDAGVKQLILPKPVVMNQAQLRMLIERVGQERIKAAVASQWYYSDFPRIIQRELQRLAADGRAGRVRRVEIEFSKEHGLAYATPPPLLELPHVLQLLSSIGLIDVAHDVPEVTGTETLVALTYRPKQIVEGVYVRASTDYHPPETKKRSSPNWDYQERTLSVYFEDDPSVARLAIDFWIKFIRSGDIAIRPGQLRLYDPEDERPRYLELHFVDDQLLTMNRMIYASFDQDFEAFQADTRVMSLERYRAIGEHLMAIQEAWELCCGGEK